MKVTLPLVGEPQPWEKWQKRLRVLTDRVETLYYPYYVAEAQVKAKGMVETRFAVWIDLCRGGEAVSETGIEWSEAEVPVKAVVPQVLTTQEAAEQARALAIHFAVAKGKWMQTPRVIVEPGKVVYRLLYVADRALLVDGISGETAPL